jgi:phosphoribosylglycinamide formyltransferase-1
MTKAVVFASGTKTGGGSGFENLVRHSRFGTLSAEVVAVVSNHADGGVKEKAEALAVPFRHFSGPWSGDLYQSIVREFGGEWFLLSGWLKPARGLDPRRTVNIHPAPLPRFGGKGMYGLKAHRAVLEAFRRGEIGETSVCMHFVTDAYDEGPVFFRHSVAIMPDDTDVSLAQRVNRAEHVWQPVITDLVVRGEIFWDGRDPSSLTVPTGYDRHLVSEG